MDRMSIDVIKGDAKFKRK